MKVSKVIELLLAQDPDEDIIIDYWTRDDFAHLLDSEQVLSDSQWRTIGKISQNLEWYSDLQDIVSAVINNETKVGN